MHNVHGWIGPLLESLARGFAWSVGWMLARGLGLPAAGAGLLLFVVFLWFRRRKAGTFRATTRVDDSVRDN